MQQVSPLRETRREGQVLFKGRRAGDEQQVIQGRLDALGALRGRHRQRTSRATAALNRDVGADGAHAAALRSARIDALPRAPTTNPRHPETAKLALPSVLEMPSPRAWAFALLGIQEYLRRFGGDRLWDAIMRRTYRIG